MNFKFLIISLITLISSQIQAQPTTLDCDLREEFIFLGCPGGRDCIPALTNPEILNSYESYYLNDEDLVVGVIRNGCARAFPLRILWYHEVINDTLGGEMITVTHCPLTGTSLVFDGTINNTEHTFGVSGLLYNNNLIMYDRLTGETLFPQMCYRGLQVENGRLKNNGEQLILLPSLETTWTDWLFLYPNTTVISNETGFERDYTTYPYGDYRTNNNLLLFPLTHEDSRLNRKDVVFGVNLNHITRVYPFKNMGERAVINDEIGGEEIVILFSKLANLVVAYHRRVGDQSLTFQLDRYFITTGLLNLRDKETGSIWNTKGEAIEGPLAEKHLRLKPVPAYRAMWFAWAAFWPDTEIADLDSLNNPAKDPSNSEEIPGTFALYQNFPNPFNSSTRINFDLSSNSRVTFKIYDVLGKEVRTILESKNLSAGKNWVVWDGKNNLGEKVSSGIYLYQIQAGKFRQSRKMLLLR